MVRPTCQGLLLSVMHSVAFAEYIQMHVDKSIFVSTPQTDYWTMDCEAFMVSRGLILMTLVISWLFL